MIIFPRTSVVINNLNSYYIILSKLLEHYQGFLNSGCIYFKSPSSEGAIYFDDENIINGVLIEKNKITKEQDAIDSLIENSDSKNYSISIFDIPQDLITYWANIYDSSVVKKVVVTKIVEFESIIDDTVKSKLTGTIEIKDHDGKIYILFLLGGTVFLSSSSDKKFELKDAQFVSNVIKEKYKTTDEIKLVIIIKSTSLIQKEFENKYSFSIQKSNDQEELQIEEEKPLKYLEMLQNLMLIFDKYINGKKSTVLFDKLLKKKFIEKVDKYSFLDPFAAEFSYNQGKINFIGSESHDVLANSMIECLNEIAQENDMKNWLKKHLTSFEEKYSFELSRLNKRISYN